MTPATAGRGPSAVLVAPDENTRITRAAIMPVSAMAVTISAPVVNG